MASSMEEQSLDLTTCCICFELYDQNKHKTKYLPCTHTFCQGCLKGIKREAGNCVTCPVCKIKFQLPVAAVEGLPNNLHAIHMVKLENDKKAGQTWCLTCEALVKPTCVAARHQTRDLLEEAKQCQTKLDEVLKGFEKGCTMRGRVDGVLQTKLKAIQAQIAENNIGRQKIQAAIVSCQEMAKLSPGMKVSPVIQKKIEQMKKEMEAEVEEAKNLLDHIAPSEINGPIEQPIAGRSVARKSVESTAEEAAEDRGASSGYRADSHGAFNAKCFAVHRGEADVPSAFHCTDLCKFGGIAVEFSVDGTLLASVGHDKVVRVWPISRKGEAGRGRNSIIAPIQMETRHESAVFTLAFAPDNRRLFTDGFDGKILNHDVETKKLLTSVANEAIELVLSISLKPGSDGNVFATACIDHVLRIFDIRRNTPLVFEAKNQFCPLQSVMFSPVDSSLIAVAGSKGAQILDIRKDSTSCIHAFGTDTNTESARFDGKGSRVLCSTQTEGPVVYNVPTEQQRPSTNAATSDKVQLKAPGYSVSIGLGCSNCCFAGVDDELVVASSTDRRFFIWSVAEGRGNRTIDQSLLSFPTGYPHPINNVSFCKATSTLASISAEAIELWTAATVRR